MARQLRVFFYLAFAAGLLSGLALADPEVGRLQVIDRQRAVASVTLSDVTIPDAKPQFAVNDEAVPN